MATSSVRDKAIVVTGAARGIGAVTAKALAAKGARLSLVGLEPEGLEQVAGECGGGAVFFEADITDAAALERAAAGTVDALGGVDAVVANAGLAAFGTVATIDPAGEARTIEVNLLGNARTIRAFLPFVTERRGYVLAVASLSALAPAPGMSAYSASKAGIEAYCNCLRVEVAHLGVDVGVAYFGWLDTDLVSAGDTHPGFAYMRSQLKGPPGKTEPVAVAATAIIRGIERRADVVAAPRWIKVVRALRGVAGPLLQRDAARFAPDVVRISEEEVARRGARAASLPGDEEARVGFRAGGVG